MGAGAKFARRDRRIGASQIVWKSDRYIPNRYMPITCRNCVAGQIDLRVASSSALCAE